MMAFEDFIHEIKGWFVLSKILVTFDGIIPILLREGGDTAKLYMKIKGPEGLNDMLIPCNKLGPPTDDDWRIANWMCTALNHAKQRTDDVLEELNLDGGEDV